MKLLKLFGEVEFTMPYTVDEFDWMLRLLNYYTLETSNIIRPI